MALIVVPGTMFLGKTLYEKAAGEKAGLAGKPFLIFSPSQDTRFHKDSLSSHRHGEAPIRVLSLENTVEGIEGIKNYIETYNEILREFSLKKEYHPEEIENMTLRKYLYYLARFSLNTIHRTDEYFSWELGHTDLLHEYFGTLKKPHGDDVLRVKKIILDETHFLSAKYPADHEYAEKYVITKVANDLAYELDVIASGLSTTFEEEPFGPMPYLLALADSIKELEPMDCMKCGERPATRNLRTVESKEKIVLGGAESYQAVCRSCYKKETDNKKSDDSEV